MRRFALLTALALALSGAACGDIVVATTDTKGGGADAGNGSDTGGAPSCVVDADCDGKLQVPACQKAVCANATCQATSDITLDGQGCDDGDACTNGETCSAGACAGGTVTDCSGTGDGVCILGVCNAATGACGSEVAAAGTACDDGDDCTQGDVCAVGACAGTPLDCSAYDAGCTLGVCEASKCKPEIQVDAPCTPAQTCVLDALCQPDGTCVGTPDTSPECTTTCTTSADCDDALTCTEDVCNGGTCIHTVFDGACLIDGACYSADEALEGDACQVCDPAMNPAGWSALACPPGGGACETSTCSPEVGCTYVMNVGATCDDGDPCTLEDTCGPLGQCVGAPDPDCGGICTTDADCPSTPSPCAMQICVAGACVAEVAPETCFIDGVCWAMDDTAPDAPNCTCSPANPLAWTCSTVPGCGDGLVVAPEECDDGNLVGGDGCSATCQADFACVNALLDGGTGIQPQLLTVRVDPWGTLTQTSGSFTTYHAPGQWPSQPQRVASCGRDTYALTSSGTLHWYRTSVGGNTIPVGSLSGFDGMWGVTCTPSDTLVVTFGWQEASQLVVVSSWQPVEASGTFAPMAQRTLAPILPPGSTAYGLTSLAGRWHPSQPQELWLVYAGQDPSIPGTGTVEAVRLGFFTSITIDTVEGPFPLGSQDRFADAVFRADGSQLVLPGLAGSCLGGWNLDAASGQLPVAAALQTYCSDDLGNALDAAMPASGTQLVLGKTDPLLVVASFDANGFGSPSALDAPFGGVRLELLYDDTRLLGYTPTGDFMLWDVEDFSAPTLLGSTSFGEATALHSVSVVRCALPGTVAP